VKNVNLKVTMPFLNEEHLKVVLIHVNTCDIEITKKMYLMQLNRIYSGLL
jgi:hypothetical protein